MGFDIINKFKDNLLKRGYEYIDSGMYDWDDWFTEMKSFISASNTDLLSLNEEDMNDLIHDVWISSYTSGETTQTLKEWASEKRSTSKSQQEVRNRMDMLFAAIENYRKSDFFKEMLRFCAQFKLLAPYNAMMVKTQMPAARYVLTPKQWLREYDRKPKLNARPLVILRKYGPVDYVFEIADTEPAHEGSYLFPPRTDEEILSTLSAPYETTSEVSQEDYNALIKALPYYGISLDKFRVAASFGAQILKTPCKVKVNGIEADGHYVISVNDKANESTEFASIIHELGHFFCRHLTAPKKGKEEWWTWRKLTWEEKEFEAEIVSFIVCGRHGVGNKSWEYLSKVIGRDGEIPQNISVDRIFKAANEVERMLEPNLDPATCLLYYNDKDFKKKYDKVFPKRQRTEETLEE